MGLCVSGPQEQSLLLFRQVQIAQPNVSETHRIAVVVL
jgi:hypothetical protein